MKISQGVWATGVFLLTIPALADLPMSTGFSDPPMTYIPNLNIAQVPPQGGNGGPSSPMSQSAIPSLRTNLNQVIKQGFPGLPTLTNPDFQTIGNTVYYNNPYTHVQEPALVNGVGPLPGISPSEAPPSDPTWGLPWDPSAIFNQVLTESPTKYGQMLALAGDSDENLSFVNPPSSSVSSNSGSSSSSSSSSAR